MKLVLDTHAALWWSSAPEHLSQTASQALEAAEQLVIPAIVFWEASLLVRRQRLALSMTISEWADAVLSIPRCVVAPLDAPTAILADSLKMHPDPADRFIVATALMLETKLVTRDALIADARVVATLW